MHNDLPDKCKEKKKTEEKNVIDVCTNNQRYQEKICTTSVSTIIIISCLSSFFFPLD